MKSYAGPAPEIKKPSLIIPVVDELPDPLQIGETVYKNDPMFPGLYIYLGDKRWVTISSPSNNIFEEHKAVADQKIFNLATSYPTDGKSINVYIDGRRLAKNEFAELGENIVCIKDDGVFKGGEKVEFQIFNKYEERSHFIRQQF